MTDTGLVVPPLRTDQATAAEARSAPHLELRGVDKAYGGTRALRGVSLAIGRGAVHALVGENGAGKSTLGKIVTGSESPDAGLLLLDGVPVRFRGPRDALRAGIALIGQEPSLVPQRTVAENVYLGVEPRRLGVIDRRALARQYVELSSTAGFALPADKRVGTLHTAEQQQVEILRALARAAQLIVLDEPTAALSSGEAQHLLDVVRALVARGTTVVYISHSLREVLAVAATISILRDGQLVRTAAAVDESSDSLVAAMLGRKGGAQFPQRVSAQADAPVVCAVRGLTRTGVIEGISFDVRAGEILGLAGLVGSGRSEVARALFGADRATSGTVTMAGARLRLLTPRDGIRAGIALLPESRKTQGLLQRRSLLENITLPHLRAFSRAGWLSLGRERTEVQALADRLDIRRPSLRAPVATLSGGNQQKVLFAKWLLRRPRLLIADEPTRGVDVGARRAIYDLIVGLAKDGVGVLLISSEAEEVLGLASRIIVMRLGRQVAELDGALATEADVLNAALGTA